MRFDQLKPYENALKVLDRSNRYLNFALQGWNTEIYKPDLKGLPAKAVFQKEVLVGKSSKIGEVLKISHPDKMKAFLFGAKRGVGIAVLFVGTMALLKGLGVTDESALKIGQAAVGWVIGFGIGGVLMGPSGADPELQFNGGSKTFSVSPGTEIKQGDLKTTQTLWKTKQKEEEMTEAEWNVVKQSIRERMERLGARWANCEAVWGAYRQAAFMEKWKEFKENVKRVETSPFVMAWLKTFQALGKIEKALASVEVSMTAKPTAQFSA